MEENFRNPDPDFVLHGRKEYIRTKENKPFKNSQKTNTLKISEFTSNKYADCPDISSSQTRKKNSPNIHELERSINDLKSELHELNKSLQENYEKSEIFLDEDVATFQKDSISHDNEDPELTFLLQRNDDEAVSHTPDQNRTWFSDPKHKSKRTGDYYTYYDLGVSQRSISPINRSLGRLGSEIVTKDVTGELKSSDLAHNEKTFPVKLTAPHIVGVRSLLPPKHSVRLQNRDRAKSPQGRSRTIDSDLLLSASLRKMLRKKSQIQNRSTSPLPVWMPTSKHANASSKTPPPFRKKRNRSSSLKRPSSAPLHKNNHKLQSQSLPLKIKPFKATRYHRPQVQPLLSSTELSFLRSADQVDTRRALVENSPYQQELARLRLERLRVEEEYLLQLKRESELERIRGPKPKWYEMKGPEFHYECNKNTSLHKNEEQWSETLEYRDQLLNASREFTENMKGPIAPLE